jgi:NAD(P)-dependent dehydrogenase (short-subunit alcohol dehydrogenase family)
LVHCAGGFRYAPIDQLEDKDLQFLIDANLRSSFYLVRALLPEMKKKNFGRLVLISSKSTLQAPAGLSAYAASKVGLNALVSAVAEEVKSFDININAVMPTVIDTPANRRDMPKADFSSWVSPAQLAEIIFSLTQPWGKPIHGALIPVAGRV